MRNGVLRNFGTLTYSRWQWNCSCSRQTLQPPILFLELLELADLVGFQPLVLFLPPIQRLLRDPHLSDQLRHRHSHFGLLQHPTIC